MKTFKQFQEETDKNMLGVYSTLGGVTALGIKAMQKVGKKATSLNIANKKLNKKVSNTRRGS